MSASFHKTTTPDLFYTYIIFLKRAFKREDYGRFIIQAKKLGERKGL
jgi:hypothetical protein